MAPTEPILGLKRLALPVSYWRAVEFGFALRMLADLPPGSRLLDLGSPKDLALLFARRYGFEVTSTDIMPAEVDLSRRSANAQGIEGSGAGRVRAEVQDGRKLNFADASFDAAFSISVLEHIPGSGDTEAMRELLRVVRPGGRVLATVPYADAHRDTFVQGTVYERESVAGEPVFFERHYDASSLSLRLLNQPRTEIAALETWGEGRIRVERMLTRLGRLRDVLSPVEALLAAVSLRRIDAGANGHRMAAFFVLTKAHP